MNIILVSVSFTIMRIEHEHDIHQVSVDMCQHENNYTGVGKLHWLVCVSNNQTGYT